VTDTPRPSLTERIAEALRTAAYDCDGNCGLTERECDAQHPIQVAACRWNTVATVYADVDAIATAVLAVVQPELGARDAEIDRLRIATQSAAVLLRAIADTANTGRPQDIDTIRHAATALDTARTTTS
jgi:hypothetical protein